MLQAEKCAPAVQNPSRPASPETTSTPAAPSSPLPDGRGSEGSPSTNGHDAKGRFGPGNMGGPGNPFARQMAGFRKFLMNCNTEEHMQTAFNCLMDLIKKGNVQALKLYYQYHAGKPDAAVNPDKLDQDEWQGYKATAGMLTEMSPLMQAPTSDLPLEMTRLGRAAKTQLLRDVTVHALEHPEEIERQKQEEERKKQEESDRQWKRLNEPPSAAVLANSPLANGGIGQGVPSTNGGNGRGQPSTNGPTVPSTNGSNGQVRPSANGDNGQARPSTNGDNGQARPSTNGDNGEVEPSTNGFTEMQTREMAIASIARQLGYDWPPK